MNKNTVKNIQERVEEYCRTRNTTKSFNELGQQYYLDKNDKNEKKDIDGRKSDNIDNIKYEKNSLLIGTNNINSCNELNNEFGLFNNND